MQVIIQGKSYELESFDDFGMLDILELKKQVGLTFEDLKVRSERMSTTDANDILSDVDLVETLGAIVWLMRRKAGERDLTFEQAIDFPLSQMEFVTDDDGDDSGND